MGYYTTFSLAVIGEPVKVAQFNKALKDTCSTDLDLEELVDTGACYCKGYDFDKLIETVAAQYPEVLVILSGDGEESDDVWEQRWRGTETERQDARIPPFVNSQLWTPNEKAIRKNA